MATILSSEVGQNVCAFLDMIAFSEIGPDLLAKSDNGYNVLVGSTPNHPLLFNSYSDHPNVYNKQLSSTAAGRYQLLHLYWAPYKKSLKLMDFSPLSQDKIAIQQVKECRALLNVQVGQIDSAIMKCAHIWASFPGAGYGQRENKIVELKKAYTDAGGTLT